MPDVTKTLAFSGCVGLSVVPARRNDALPAVAMAIAVAARTSAAMIRAAAGTASRGPILARPHMIPPTITATIGGGIVVSRNLTAGAPPTWPVGASARRQHAELVAVGIGHDHPPHVTLTDVRVRRAHRDQAVHLRLLIA